MKKFKIVEVKSCEDGRTFYYIYRRMLFFFWDRLGWRASVKEAENFIEWHEYSKVVKYI